MSAGRRRRVLPWLGGAVVVALVALVLVAVVAGVGRDDGDVAEADRDGITPALRVEGARLVDDRGERHVMFGSTLYAFPFYLTEGWIDWPVMVESRRNVERLGPILDRMVEVGLNSVRIPLGTDAWSERIYSLSEQEWLDRIELVVDEADRRGLHVVLTWWDALTRGEEWPERHEESFPFMRAVHERVGSHDNVLIEPMNEPREIDWDEWFDATSSTVRFWRDELGYDGVLILDTIDWSWNFDPDVARRMVEVDAEALGEPNLLFAIHRYANENDCFCGEEADEWERTVGRHVEDHPIVVTEFGNLNGDWEPSPTWVRQFSDRLATEDLPAGLNGVVFFTWRWQDENTMTEPDAQQLTPFGTEVLDRLVPPAGGPAVPDE